MEQSDVIHFLTWLELIFPDRIGFPDKAALARGYMSSEFLAAVNNQSADTWCCGLTEAPCHQCPLHADWLIKKMTATDDPETEKGK